MNIILFDTNELAAPLPVKDDRGKHILKVLKCREGDTIDVGVLNGKTGTARITEITGEFIYLDIKLTSDPPAPYPLGLVLGMVRPITAKRIFKDCTTMGIESLWITATEKGEKSYLQSNLMTDGNYLPFLIDGAQQGVTTYIPDMKKFYTLGKCLETLPEGTEKIVLHNYEFDFDFQSWQYDREEGKRVILAVGSERGWSEREIELFKTFGFKVIKMGSRVLRTETACAAGIALVLHKMGFIL